MQILELGTKSLFTIVQRINELIMGRTNAAGQVELAGTGTETLVEGLTIGDGTKPMLTPANAAAATEYAAGTCWADSVTNGSFKIKHSAGVSGRVFNYLTLG